MSAWLCGTVFPRTPFSSMFLIRIWHRGGSWATWRVEVKQHHFVAHTLVACWGTDPCREMAARSATAPPPRILLASPPLGASVCQLVLFSVGHHAIKGRDFKDCQRLQPIFLDSNLFLLGCNLCLSALPSFLSFCLQARSPTLIHFSLGIAKW